MRKLLLGAAAIVTAILSSTGASAAVVMSNSSFSLTQVGSSYLGVFGNLDPDQGRPSGLNYQGFVDTFTFNLPAGIASGSASGGVGTFGFRLFRTDLDFTQVTLNGKPFAKAFEDVLGADLQLLSSTPLTAGVQTLVVSGNSQRFGSYLGELSFTPDFAAGVPEPATWAMMIIGFGAVGGTLRRRAVKSAFGERKARLA